MENLINLPITKKSLHYNHKKNGTWIERKRANNASIVSSTPAPLPSVARTDITKLQGSIDTLTTMFKNWVSKKRLLIDSGCNINIIASPLHSDIPIIYRDSEEGYQLQVVKLFLLLKMDLFLIFQRIMFLPLWIAY